MVGCNVTGKEMQTYPYNNCNVFDIMCIVDTSGNFETEK